MDRTYHVALVNGGYYGRRATTLVIEMRRSIDGLSCEAWRYEGIRETTKARVRSRRYEFMRWVNERYNQHFTHCIVD